MARLLHLHACADVADTSEALAPFVFIKDKYAQDCWLKASLEQAPKTAGSPSGPSWAAAFASPAHAGMGSHPGPGPGVLALGPSEVQPMLHAQQRCDVLMDMEV